MTDETVEPEAFRIPTVAQLDAMRVGARLSQRELSRRAGLEEGRFNAILHNDMDPQTATMRSLLEVLQETDPRAAAEIDRTGPKPASSPHSESGDSETEDRDTFWQRLDAMDADDLGDDPSPPDNDIRTDGGPGQTGTERFDLLHEKLAGGYIYGGDGDWSKINEVVGDSGEIEFRTTAVGYDSVPHETRQEAYDAYDGQKTVIVHPDGIEFDDGPELMTDGGVDQTGTWHSGPADPEELKDYFEWLLNEHDGQLVESPIEGDDYYIEVTRCEEVGDDVLRSVEGARVEDGGDRDV